MRIIAGEKGGRRLVCPRGLATRPTLERVREAIFSHLAGAIPDAAVLDLFAGAGTLGLEALSRGAASVVFVENGRRALASLAENIKTLDLADRSRLIRADALAFVKRAGGGGPGNSTGQTPGRAPAKARNPSPRFDLVFADPPYGKGIAQRTLALMDSAAEGLLAEGATVVIETGGRDAIDSESLRLLRAAGTREYGETTIHFFRRD